MAISILHSRKKYVVAKLLILATAAMVVLFILHLAIRQQELTSRINVMTSRANQVLDKNAEPASLETTVGFEKGETLIGLLRQIASSLNTTNRVFKFKVNVMADGEPANTQLTESDVARSVSFNRDKFRNILDDNQKSILLNLATKIASVCDSLDITYIMYGGTLLGSYRHHDIIPWDDDIDIVVHKNDRVRLFKALQELHPNYEVFSAGPRLKFNSINSVKQSKYRWKWPYIDIHFFQANETHIWDSAHEFSHYIYKVSDIFPLHKRPLGGVFLNAPKDSYAYLKATYTNTKCQTHFYSHRYELNSMQKRVSIPCEFLKKQVPFVHRSPDSEGVRETLMLNNAIVHSIVVQEPLYAITKPYSLRLI